MSAGLGVRRLAAAFQGGSKLPHSITITPVIDRRYRSGCHFVFQFSIGGSLDGPVRDGRVDSRHAVNGLFQSNDDLLIVLDVIPAQCPATPVFEPLLAHLIPADVKFPDFGRDAFEVLAAL